MTRFSARVARLPLRVRLVAGFSATMLLVLAAAAAFVCWRVAFALDRQVNEDLNDVSRRIAPFVTPTGPLAKDAPALANTEGYQVLDRSGKVLASSPSLGAHPLVAPAVARKSLSKPVRKDIGRLLPINNHPLRAYATRLPHADSQQAAVLVVAVRRDHRDEALLELLVQLAVAGLGALLVTAAVGERLARLALRPVERYRVQAANIIAGASGVRLQVPPDRDDEVTRLGHTLNATLDALEMALETERSFVNDASHELRTPLTLLKTRVQLALRRPRTAAEHEAVLAEIETDLVRLTELTEQLLRLGTPNAEPDLVPTDLARLAEQEVSRRNSLRPGGREPQRQAGGAPTDLRGRLRGTRSDPSDPGVGQPRPERGSAWTATRDSDSRRRARCRPGAGPGPRSGYGRPDAGRRYPQVLSFGRIPLPARIRAGPFRR